MNDGTFSAFKTTIHEVEGTELLDFSALAPLFQEFIDEVNKINKFGKDATLDSEKTDKAQSKIAYLYTHAKPVGDTWSEHYKKEVFDNGKYGLNESEKCRIFINFFMNARPRLNQWVENSIHGFMVEKALARGMLFKQTIQKFFEFVKEKSGEADYRFDFDMFERNIRQLIDAISKGKTITYRQPNAD